MGFVFNEEELKTTGTHTQFGIYGAPDTEAPNYNYPITPKENMLRMLRGEKPLWVPNQTLENNALQPLVMDDARARNFGGKDWFGIELLNEDIYFINFVPSSLMISDVLIVVGCAVVMSFIASIYPAIKASKIDPAQELNL